MLGNGQWDIPELTRLISEVIPKLTALVDYEISHTFPNIGERTFLLTARRLWKPDNNSTNVLLVFNDVTASREKERESSLMFSELRHRMTNLLGIVRALANQTDAEGRSADEYKAAFLGRFEALMNAQLLLGGGSKSVELDALISRIVDGLGGNRLNIAGGPAVMVAELQIVPLTMILHELGTNALKYGAFSGDSGTVDVSWQIIDDEHRRLIRLVWTEACASPTSTPTRTSTGMGIIQRSAELGLQGTAELDFTSGGLVATLLMPLIGNDGQ